MDATAAAILDPFPEGGVRAGPPDGTTARLRRETLAGLAGAQKTVPSRWLYDDAGSALFEAITVLPEYYPTRTETAILESHASEMLAGTGRGAALIEYGAGASVKTRLLLDACEAPALYIPLDVSDAFDVVVSDALRRRYPGMAVRPVTGDFLDPQTFPLEGVAGAPIGLFLGSTIGNLEDGEIRAFLSECRRSLGDGARLLLGVDVRKDAATLEAAYDDVAGVTARFDLNLLVRLNRELGADFDVDAFAHEARWNAAASRIEMHLVARRAMRVRIDGRAFRFEVGESIRTEISRKFGPGDIEAVAVPCGWSAAGRWTDAGGLFSVLRLDAA